MLGLLLPEFLGLVQYLGALHPEQQEHRDDGQQGRHRVRDDERQRVVAGDEEDVEDRGGGEVAGQQAARVGEDGLGVDDRQAEEGDGPDPVEDLKGDERSQGEELKCQHEEDHLAGYQHHHPEEEEFLPRELGVEPFRQDLDVAGDDFPQLGLHLLGEPLLDHGDLERVELRGWPKSVGAGFGFGCHSELLLCCHGVTGRGLTTCWSL